MTMRKIAAKRREKSMSLGKNDDVTTLSDVMRFRLTFFDICICRVPLESKIFPKEKRDVFPVKAKQAFFDFSL